MISARTCWIARSYRAARPVAILALGASLAAALALVATVDLAHADGSPLAGTEPLEFEGDLASDLVDGVDRYLVRKIDESVAARASHWDTDRSSPAAYEASLTALRERLAHILGVRDQRPDPVVLEPVATATRSALVGRGARFEVYAVRWQAFGDVYAEGLLLLPQGRAPIADVVAIPDADQLPEQIAGLVAGTPAESQFARRLAESGCRVLVPTLIDRTIEPRRQSRLTNREFIYRPAFEMGRHVVGYEVQQVLAAIDWFVAHGDDVELTGLGGGRPAADAPATGISDEPRPRVGPTDPGIGVKRSQSLLLQQEIERRPGPGGKAAGGGAPGNPGPPREAPPGGAAGGGGAGGGGGGIGGGSGGGSGVAGGGGGGARRESLVRPRGVVGWGEGGFIALAAAALDPRIEAVLVSGFFGPRESTWEEPIDRNVFALLERFGGAELAAMVAPRALIVEAAAGPEVEIAPGQGGAPGRLTTPDPADVERELARAAALIDGLSPAPIQRLVKSRDGYGPPGSDRALAALIEALVPGALVVPSGATPEYLAGAFDPAPRLERRLHELDRHTQALLAGAADVRRDFFARLDTSSLEAFQSTVEPYREYFREQVIGRFDDEPLPPNPRTRQVYDEPAYTGYEVLLDVFPDVVAYGILLVPKGLAEGERRPVVVCQHGLEGRPQDLSDPAVDNAAYHRYACRLAERGLITFAPQNLYLFGDRFRTLQRKANPLGRTLFSIIVPQHQQIVDWLASRPEVDPDRIGFYGLSYGGKTAMRVPALVEGYALSICSADFNEWVWKNASTASPYSYVWTGEYEIFEFDLGNTFNYAEMAALIAPRPFMVERGHFDGVAPDEAVAYEFAKVRHLYAARLGLPERAEIEWFVGPHTIHGEGTFAFLERHLQWPPAP